jgi:hypothetical protein
VTDIKLLGYVYTKLRTYNFQDYAFATQSSVFWYVGNKISEKSATFFVVVKILLLYRVAERNGWFLSNKLHGETSQKKVTFIVTELKNPETHTTVLKITYFRIAYDAV